MSKTNDTKSDDTKTKTAMAPHFDAARMVKRQPLTRLMPTRITLEVARAHSQMANSLYYEARHVATVAREALSAAKANVKAAEEKLLQALAERDTRLAEADALVRPEEHNVELWLDFSRNVALEVRTDTGHEGEIWRERALTPKEHQLQLGDIGKEDAENALQTKILELLRQAPKGLTPKALGKKLPDVTQLNISDTLKILSDNGRVARSAGTLRYCFLAADSPENRQWLMKLLRIIPIGERRSTKRFARDLNATVPEFLDALLLGDQLGNLVREGASTWFRPFPNEFV